MELALKINTIMNLKSSNVWLAVITLFGAAMQLFFQNAFPTEEAKTILSSVLAAVPAGNIMYHYFRDLEKRQSLKEFFKTPNFVLSLLATLVGIFPALAQFLPEAEALVRAIYSGSLQQILFAAFTFVMLIYNGVFKRPAAAIK